DSPLQNVTVRILSDLPGNASTSSDGSYKMGLGSEGMHMVRFFKEGFHIQEVAIDLRATEQIIQDIRLEPLEQYQISGTVIDDESGEPISLAQVVVLNDLYDERTATGQNGNFNLTSYEGDFVIAAGKWGHIHGTRTHTIGSDLSNMEIRMQTGYRDDFVFNYGWSVMSQGVSATTTRQWARGVPQGYTYDGNLANPEADIKDDFGRTCFVTGLEGTSAGNLGDTSTLFSPEFDISDYNDPYLNYYLWFFDDGVNPSDDVLEIYLSNGIIEVLIEKLSSSASEWRDRSEWRINDFLEPTDRMQLRIFAADAGNVHIYEAGLDGFSVTEGLTTSAKPENDKFSITLGPNPFNQVLHMYAPNHSIGVHYQIVNVMSQSLTQGIVLAKHTTIDTTLLPSGVHVLILRSTDGSIESRKLVKL
ncbi:MAG: carboxypeptidase-like regulatory domain-containing protein, partial [Saprospiraceae bacterium]|nr:carboxypeptidase-like regulatory domain-containing protein [Saprospiraceae bacterium]